MKICDLFFKEVIRFSAADNRRSIPSMLDGLKPSQRKITHTLMHLKRSETKVAQLAAATADFTNYHHGEEALVSTIIGMAQPWVGMNNASTLTYNGQHGSRHAPKSAAAGRYIFTQLAPIAAAIYPKADAAVLDYLEEEGQKSRLASSRPWCPWFSSMAPMASARAGRQRSPTTRHARFGRHAMRLTRRGVAASRPNVLGVHRHGLC